MENLLRGVPLVAVVTESAVLGGNQPVEGVDGAVHNAPLQNFSQMLHPVREAGVDPYIHHSAAHAPPVVHRLLAVLGVQGVPAAV